MTESTILVICFILTFGFIGYKLYGLIRKILDDYRKKIEDNINKSEELKLQAITAFDEVNRKNNNIDEIIQKMQNEADIKIKDIQKNFNDKLKKMLEKATEDSKKKIQIEQQNEIEKIKEQIKKAIEDIINEYAKNMNKNEKENAIDGAIKKIDFKKLLSN